MFVTGLVLFTPGLLTAGLCTTEGNTRAKAIVFGMAVLGIVLVCLSRLPK